jgi:hypothetical protein
MYLTRTLSAEISEGEDNIIKIQLPQELSLGVGDIICRDGDSQLDLSGTL